MNEQLKDLVQRATESDEERQRQERGKTFFDWFENTFEVKQYEKSFVRGRAAATVDNTILFYLTDSEEMAADVLMQCVFCEEENPLHKLGTVHNLEGLGECLKKSSQLEESETLYFDCGQHSHSDVAGEYDQIDTEGEQTGLAEPKKIQPKRTGKPFYPLTVRFSLKNYDEFSRMMLKTKNHALFKMRIKTRESHIAEMAIMMACDIFNKDKEAFWALFKEKVEKS